MIKLRTSQRKAHDLIIHYFRENKKVLFKMMAGGGKSITAGSFISKYHMHYKFVLIVRKRDLVKQLAKDALDTFNLDYSIYMAGSDRMDLNNPIQVCSKDTLQSREDLPFLGEPNVVIIVDEADEFPEYQREIIRKYFSASDRVFYLGMTATPFNGLDMYDVCIEPIRPKEMLKEGILIPFRYYIPKVHDLSDVRIENGAFSSKDLVKKLDTPKQIADAFSAWLNYGEYRQTLIFCINKEHSRRVVEYINAYYKKDVAIHLDAESSDEEREKAKNNFKKGILKFISVVGLFKRGTNIPEIGTILDLASTLSLNNHIQKLGRGSRKNEFYQDCILIDYANNLINLGHFYQDREVDLHCKYRVKKEDLEVLQMRVCESCFRAAEPQAFLSNNICPFCGFKNSPIKKKKLSKYKENKIFLETASEEAIEQKAMINEFKKSLWVYRNLGKRYSNDIAREKACLKLLDKYGTEKCLKIQGSMGLTKEIIEKHKRRQYIPLGGMQL